LFFYFIIIFFLFFYFSSEIKQQTKTQIGRRLTLTWKEMKPNFSEICIGVFEEKNILAHS